MPLRRRQTPYPAGSVVRTAVRRVQHRRMRDRDDAGDSDDHAGEEQARREPGLPTGVEHEVEDVAPSTSPMPRRRLMATNAAT